MTPAQMISFINGFTKVSDAEVAQYCVAQGIQFARDVAPIWGICPSIEFIPGAVAPTDGASPAWLTDTLDVDGALGYHDEDQYGRVYIRVANFTGYDWRTTASHECLEVKGDSPANMWAQGPNNQMFAYELSDPVEGDTYDINGVPMSNFVYPAWFDPNAQAGSRFDHLGKLSAPFTMTAGGYMIVWTLKGAPTQVFGSHMEIISEGVHIHFGPEVSQSKRHGIINKYRKTGRRSKR